MTRTIKPLPKQERIVLEILLDSYRDKADIDEICANMSGSALSKSQVRRYLYALIYKGLVETEKEINGLVGRPRLLYYASHKGVESYYRPHLGTL